MELGLDPKRMPFSPCSFPLLEKDQDSKPENLIWILDLLLTSSVVLGKQFDFFKAVFFIYQEGNDK